jgi:hypothetical protein
MSPYDRDMPGATILQSQTGVRARLASVVGMNKPRGTDRQQAAFAD